MLMHPTLVSLKNANTASVAFSLHNRLTEGALLLDVSTRTPSLYPSTASWPGAPGPALCKQVVAGQISAIRYSKVRLLSNVHIHDLLYMWLGDTDAGTVSSTIIDC